MSSPAARTIEALAKERWEEERGSLAEEPRWDELPEQSGPKVEACEYAQYLLEITQPRVEAEVQERLESLRVSDAAFDAACGAAPIGLEEKEIFEMAKAAVGAAIKAAFEGGTDV